MIDYRMVTTALSHYERWGYENVETPWYVCPEVVKATLPKDRHGFFLGHPESSPGCLVGSAEQGFLQLMEDGKLTPGGKYVSAGPCFRDDVEDDLHQLSFFKVELIRIEGRVTPLDDNDVMRLMDTAKRLFDEEFYQRNKTRIVKTEAGYDIELNGIEIGSYGIRKHGKHRWIYGTGLALPRFSLARASG